VTSSTVRSATAPPDAKVITVNGRTSDPREKYAHDAQDTDYLVLSIRPAFNTTRKSDLATHQVELLECLGDGNFLCRYKPSDLEALRNLDFARQVDIYRRQFKIPKQLLPLLEQQASRDPSKTCCVDVMVHEGISDLDKLAEDIAQKTGVSQSQIEILE
jgi:serine protease AprX